MNNKIMHREVPTNNSAQTRVTVRVPVALAGVTELRVVKHPAMQLLEAFANAAKRR